MKTAQVTLLLSCLLCIFSPKNGLVSGEPVLDTTGKELRAGSEYYILPANSGNGGGFTLGSARNTSCPLEVVQNHNEANDGLAVAFSPVDPKDRVVRVSVDQNIKFSGASAVCAGSGVWKVSSGGEPAGRLYVITGGVEGNPGRETLSNWFQIRRLEDAYQLTYCPGVCAICRPRCGNIGIVTQNGARLLAQTSEQFKVVFKKA